MIMLLRVRFYCALVALMGLATPGMAEMRALLVGVSDYDDSIGLADLKGPANDIRLLHSVLDGRGVADITVLADGVTGGGIPTRANILTAMANLAARSGAGDLVYVHLSGHGTRQPDPQGDETDGLDEVFLPADTGRAPPGSNAIPNALVDDDIGKAVHAIRQTGADVWLVMDSCNSGTGLRAAAPGTAVRYVEPSVLGVDAQGTGQTEAQIIESDGPPPPGGIVAFYSARSSELAREISFASDSGPDQWYGLFTAKLAARLQEAQGLSYRQLFQAVLSDMNDASVPGAGRLQTPGWDSTMIDAAVFGGRATSGIRRFAVSGDEVQAGLVHGLGNGTLLGLVADAAAPPDAIIGFAQTEDASATTAYLRPVAASCTPRAAAPCAFDGSLPATARFAQIVARPVDMTLRLAPPRDLASGDDLAVDSAQNVALDAAIREINTAGQRQVVLDAANFDVEIYWSANRLWFGPRAAIGTHPVGLAVAPDPVALVPALIRIARAEDLARLLGSVAGNATSKSPSPVAVSADLMAVAVDDLAAPGAGTSPRRECRSAQALVQGGANALAPGSDVKQCDMISFRAVGTTPGARDLNRIHIDSQFCVDAEYAQIEDATAARVVGRDMTMCSDCPGGYSAGQERLFVIVTEARDNAEPLDLRGLVETCGPGAEATRGNTDTRTPAQAQVVSFLTSLSARPGTRGSFDMGVADVWVERYDWRILPKPEAFLRGGRATDN